MNLIGPISSTFLRLRVLRGLRLILAGPTLALAQGQALVRGDVVQADGATRARGVIVELTEADTVVARTLTSDRGTFSARLPRAGRYAGRLLRIGFRPTPVPLFDVANGVTKELHLVLGSEPVHLAEVRVDGEDVCRVRSDSGRLVAQVWEETRKALTSTSISESGSLQASTSITFRSTRDATGNAMLWQDYATVDNFTTKPFRSAPARALAASGYSTPESSGAIWFLGPDADALISDEFAASHCFRLVAPPRGRAEWLGVAFRPIRDRDGITEIAGTFWVDRASAELRLLEYRYTNIPLIAERNGAGGRIEFARLASGDWLVNRWHIRAVTQVVTRPATPRPDLPQPRIPIAGGTGERTTIYMTVTGGEARSVERGAEELYAGGGVGWDAVLSSIPGDSGATGGTIEFIGTGYFATADSSNRLHLDHLLSDRYDALVSTRAMRVLGMPALRRTVNIAVASRPAPDTIALPPDDSILAFRCGRNAVTKQQALLFGRSVDWQRDPVPFDTLVVRWTLASEKPFVPGTQNARGEDVVADAFGRWYVCGLPRDASVYIGKDLDHRDGTILFQQQTVKNMRLAEVDLVDRHRPQR